MKSTQRDDFEQIADQMSQMVSKLWQWHTGDFCPTDTWSPAINLYRLENRLEICVDLAGVDPKTIEVRVEPGELIIRGGRHSPEPRDRGRGENMHIIAMEIDHGRFCRTVPLPNQIELLKVDSQYENGLLWIRLPLRAPG